jgi:hypothetical protein
MPHLKSFTSQTNTKTPNPTNRGGPAKTSREPAALPFTNMPLNRRYEEIEPWFCETGQCGWACQIIRVEAAPLFLKLLFSCPVCLAEATRYFDLQEHGYVEAGGISARDSHNVASFVETRERVGRDKGLHYAFPHR